LTLVEGAIDDETERTAALAALAELSLIKHDPFEDGAPAVTAHRLVQAVARAKSDAFMRLIARTRVIERLAAIYPANGYTKSRVMAALRAADAASPNDLRNGNTL